MDVTAYDAKKRDMAALAEYKEKLRREPRLKYLFFELTDRCNLHCAHCGSRCGAGGHSELAFKDVKRVLTETAGAFGTKDTMICLTGGEPMLHRDFFRIGAEASRLGFFWGMTTNGILIDAHAADACIQAGLGSAGISLDGLRETHDAFRDCPGAFDGAVRGIREFVKRGMYFEVTTVVFRHNLRELPKLYAFLRSLGVRYWKIMNMEPIGRALERQDLALTPEEFRVMLDFIREKRFDKENDMDVSYGCSHYLTPEYERMTRDALFICGAGIFIASVTCNGDIIGCLDIERRPQLVQGNIAVDSFPQVWREKFGVFRRDRSESSAVCADCPDRPCCGGDSMHTWDFEKNAPRLCVKKYLEL